MTDIGAKVLIAALAEVGGKATIPADDTNIVRVEWNTNPRDVHRANCLGLLAEGSSVERDFQTWAARQIRLAEKRGNRDAHLLKTWFRRHGVAVWGGYQ